MHYGQSGHNMRSPSSPTAKKSNEGFFFVAITKEDGYKLSGASDWDNSEITNWKTPKPNCPPELKQKQEGGKVLKQYWLPTVTKQES